MVNRTDNRSNASPSLAIPEQLRSFSEPCHLLPGESRSDFEVIRQMMVDDVQPETNMEWLWTLDLVELSWEILRYRSLKQRVLEQFRHSAIRAILMRLEGAGMPAEQIHLLEFQVDRIAAQWRDDGNAAIEIEARLRKHGFDDIVINAEVFDQGRELFATFDGLMHGAQNRRMILLREIEIRRDFARRAKKSSDAVIEGKFVRVPKGAGLVR